MTMTYAQLKQAVQDYTENDETSFVNNIPLFIRLAEERILKSVRLNLFQKNQFGNMSSSNKYLAAPSDFLAPFSLSLTDGDGDIQFLEFKELDFVQTYTPDESVTGVPRYYAQFDGDYSAGTTSGHFIIAPSPDANYQAQLHYYFDPPSIVDTGTSWLGENAETALLYGTLVEAYRFLKGDNDLMQAYDKTYQESMAALSSIGVRSRGDAYRQTELA